MERLLLFLGLSLLASGLLLGIQIQKRRLKPGVLWGLFMFGVLLSVPFVTVEYVGAHLKYYFMILSFIGIESVVSLLEHKWKYLHHLVHQLHFAVENLDIECKVGFYLVF